MREHTVWVLRGRYAELGLNLRSAWDIYIRFYTVFLTFSIAALAWVFTYEKVTPALRMVAWTFFAQTAMTAVTSVLISLHSCRVRRAQEQIEVLLLAEEKSPLPNTPSPISVAMATWAGGANGLAMAGMAVIWLYVALQ
jgi:hypothetical protein